MTSRATHARDSTAAQSAIATLALWIAAGVLSAAMPDARAQELETTAAMTDREITNAVEDELYYDPVISFDEIEVYAEDGVVTLEGRVESLLESRRAERIATTVKGVRSVANQIEIDPLAERSPGRSSAWVRTRSSMIPRPNPTRSRSRPTQAGR